MPRLSKILDDITYKALKELNKDKLVSIDLNNY